MVGTELAKPKFISKIQKISPAEIGTATHLVMQLLDLETAPTTESVQQLISNLVEEKVLQPEVAEKIDQASILAFFATEFGQLLLNEYMIVKREQPFSLLIKAKDIFADYSGDAMDRLLVHGIIDGFVETEEALILYDFKTDYVPEAADEAFFEKIKAKYRGQLNLYQSALEQIKGKKVTSVKLILLRENQILEMLE